MYFNPFYDYYYYGTQRIAFMVIAFGVFGTLLTLCTIYTILCNWKMFEKAGEKGWKAMIPFYSDIIKHKITLGSGWYILVPTCLSAMAMVPNYNIGMRTILLILTFAWSFFYYVAMAKAFGKKEEFAVGLLFLTPIFEGILAFGDSKYVAPQDILATIVDKKAKSQEDNSKNVAGTTAEAETTDAKKADEKIAPATQDADYVIVNDNGEESFF